MYHTYPYKAQIPVLIDGSYQKRTFTSNDDVWAVIDLIIAVVGFTGGTADSSVDGTVYTVVAFVVLKSATFNKNVSAKVPAPC